MSIKGTASLVALVATAAAVFAEVACGSGDETSAEPIGASAPSANGMATAPAGLHDDAGGSP